MKVHQSEVKFSLQLKYVRLYLTKMNVLFHTLIENL